MTQGRTDVRRGGEKEHMRRILALAVAAAATAVPLAATSTAGTPPAAAAGRCAPDPTSTPVASRRLPGGVRARVYTAPARTAAGRPTSARVTVVTARLGRRVGLRPMLSSVTSRRTVHAHASRRGVIAAVNGDYFDYGARTNTGYPIWPIILRGRPVKAADRWSPVLGIGTDGKLHTTMVGLDASVTAGGRTFPVRAVNTRGVGGLSVFTARWGPGQRRTGYREVWVSGGKVVATRRLRDRIPAKVTVLSATAGSRAVDFLTQLRRGQEVEVRLAQRPDHEGVVYRAALGRGPRVLEDGVNIADCGTAESSATRPRTGIGWRDGGSTVIFMTVNASPKARLGDAGMTYHQAATALRAAGATDGVLVDGGGSTTMEVRRRMNQAPVRFDQRPSYQRPVPNGYAFFLR